MSDHLYYVTTDRGFKRLPPIISAYPGGHVEVYESSAAEGPHIWLAATAPVNLNEPDGDKFTSPIHLTAEDAWKLADQLRHLVRLHYQGGDPEWLNTYGSTE